eukprot:TRINITY_DN31498_c0_g1_i1.p1 TRINITY_DN31498_c0_g1~~TRINITY_DN31498_c0_g1_i1.p1  ORF type:complete len:462 (-),score=60.53 TRINITY_DN31498_c0_g1_i1:14-1336(-)
MACMVIAPLGRMGSKSGARCLLLLQSLAHLAFGSAVYSEEEAKIIHHWTCLPNGPSQELDTGECVLDEDVAKWLSDTSVGYMLSFINIRKGKEDEVFDQVQSAWDESPCASLVYPPLKRAADTGLEYYICKRQVRSTKNDYGKNNSFMLFLPHDNEQTIGECEWLLPLIQLATKSIGVAIDIGATDGDCSFPMLSQGHTVYLFEHGYKSKQQRDYVQMTLDINSWQTRSSLHTAVNETLSLKGLTQKHEKVELLKIDVDTVPEYNDVWQGILPILGKTEIVQIELITHEIGVKGKLSAHETFSRAGFEMYGLEDLDTFPGYYHGALAHFCDKRRLREKTVSENKRKSGYRYGVDGAKHIHLHPICSCRILDEPIFYENLMIRDVANISREDVIDTGKAAADLFECGMQYAFVRRSSDTMAVVSARFGSCAGLCSKAPEEL